MRAIMQALGLRIGAAFAVVAVIVGAATAASAQEVAAPPRADHHRHLVSPLMAAEVDGPSLPQLSLPAPITELLGRRESLWSDPTSLAALYAVDATTIGLTRSGWVTGRAAVGQTLGTMFARPFRIVPTQARITPNEATIGGYYARLQGQAPEVGYFILNLRRQEDGTWLIQDEVPRFPMPAPKARFDAAALVSDLDQAGIGRAAILSEAFWFDSALRVTDDSYPKVMAENDWTADQAERFPDRLVAFCSFNPIADHALLELARCADSGRFRGFKLSFAMSGVDLKNDAHLERVTRVFAEAERRRLPIIVHLRGAGDYGRRDVELFLEHVMPVAPSITVQVAHLWGGEAYAEDALEALAEAVLAGTPAARNLVFDVSEVWLQQSPVVLQESARRMRQIGFDRILFGSDAQAEGARAWSVFCQTAPLEPAEFRQIALNVAPYLTASTLE